MIATADETSPREDRGFTRIKNVTQPDFDPNAPRLGRRESEPHSAEINYLRDVLHVNFPADRVTWDLHHYFKGNDPSRPDEEDFDIQFDISYFRNMTIDEELPSYVATDHENRIPTMAVNVLSKSTWAVDLSDHVEKCKLLGVPLYVVFPAYHVATWPYKPPFLRAYVYQPDTKEYKIHDVKQAIIKEGEESLQDVNCNDKEKLLDTSDIVPFRIGLMERKTMFKGGLSTWRMILVHPTEPCILPTATGKEQERAEKERERAEKERERADMLQEKIDRYNKKFGPLD
nr:Uma2 family endonuclease [Candidatus Sigynarchaeota archaeon]